MTQFSWSILRDEEENDNEIDQKTQEEKYF